MSQNLNYVFLDPITIQCINLIVYHDVVMIVAVGVMGLVVWFLMVFWYKNWFFGNISNYKFQKNHYLECFWTFIPIVILVGLGYESLMNLCAGEVSDDLDYKVKITAHQWYWSYEYIVGGRNKGDSADIKQEKSGIFSRKKLLDKMEEGGVNADFDGVGSKASEPEVLINNDAYAVENIVLRSYFNMKAASLLSGDGLSFFDSFNIKVLKRGYYDDNIYVRLKDFYSRKGRPKTVIWEDYSDRKGVKSNMPWRFINGPIGWKIHSHHLQYLLDNAKRRGEDYSTSFYWRDFIRSTPNVNARLGDHVMSWLGRVCRFFRSYCEDDKREFFLPSWDRYITSLKLSAAIKDIFFNKECSWINKLECEIHLANENLPDLKRKLLDYLITNKKNVESYELLLSPKNFYRSIGVSKEYWEKHSSSTFPKRGEFFINGYGSGGVSLENLSMRVKDRVKLCGFSSKVDRNSFRFLNSIMKNSGGLDPKHISLKKSSASVIDKVLLPSFSSAEGRDSLKELFRRVSRGELNANQGTVNSSRARLNVLFNELKDAWLNGIFVDGISEVPGFSSRNVSLEGISTNRGGSVPEKFTIKDGSREIVNIEHKAVRNNKRRDLGDICLTPGELEFLNSLNIEDESKIRWVKFRNFYEKLERYTLISQKNFNLGQGRASKYLDLVSRLEHDTRVKTSLELEKDSPIVKLFKEKYSKVGLYLSPNVTRWDLRRKLNDAYQLFLRQYEPRKDKCDSNVFEYKADHYGVRCTLFSHLLSLGDRLLRWDVDGFGLDYLLIEFSRDGSTTDWLYLPAGCSTEITVTSADVIHRWGVPAFGLKVDAIPGRLNRVIVKPLYVGVALGNCYELCGYGHRVIPINVLVVPEKYYLNNLHKDLIADHPLK